MTILSASKRLLILVVVVAVGCKKGESSGLPFQTVGRQPDVAPVMLNKELPFRYPPALYAQKVQGNVTLRIFIDSNGAIVPDSTRIAETSGFTALDSAAMKDRAEKGASLGLIGMQERVALVGGEFECKSAPGQGAEIRAVFAVRR